MAKASLHLASKPATYKDDYWTPPEVCRVVHTLFGGPPELDPASCPEANAYMQARRIYTKEQDGLLRDWSARTLWLNPPFSAKYAFLEKFSARYAAGDFAQALCLLPASTGTAAFQRFARGCWRCEWAGRLKFIGGTGSCTFDSLILYLGRKERRFEQVFGEHGAILSPARTTGRYAPVQHTFPFRLEESAQ
jgi:hypothetical protein